MLYQLLKFQYTGQSLFYIILITFLITIVAIQATKNILPQDGGRAFAVNGELSKGKPRGVGIVFIICYVVMSLLYVPLNREYMIYTILLVASMLSGFLDDRSEIPWGGLKKGLIDLAIALMAAITFVNYNTEHIGLQFQNKFFSIPVVVYVILAVILFWASINVTNCSDGVDGLCGSLGVVTLLTFYCVFSKQHCEYGVYALMMIACLLGYLWFNMSPSKVLMGDAGSRALGFFIGVLALKSYNPLLYLLAAFMFILDGGLGLIKVSLIRVCKIHIMKNIRTPIHDHARKNLRWSDTQVVFRFVVIQLIASSIIFFCYF